MSKHSRNNNKRNPFTTHPDGSMRKVGETPIPSSIDEIGVPNYDRRRVASALVGFFALMLAGAGIKSLVSDSSLPEAPPATTVVIAKEGDSLWELQSKEGSPAGKTLGETVYDVVKMNGGSVIYPGQPIKLIDGPKNPTQNS